MKKLINFIVSVAPMATLLILMINDHFFLAAFLYICLDIFAEGFRKSKYGVDPDRDQFNG